MRRRRPVRRHSDPGRVAFAESVSRQLMPFAWAADRSARAARRGAFLHGKRLTLGAAAVSALVFVGFAAVHGRHHRHHRQPSTRRRGRRCNQGDRSGAVHERRPTPQRDPTRHAELGRTRAFLGAVFTGRGLLVVSSCRNGFRGCLVVPLGKENRRRDPEEVGQFEHHIQPGR